jgi:hypothetical protein
MTYLLAVGLMASGVLLWLLDLAYTAGKDRAQ